ncbi:cell adhesion molecule CEACAM1-like [Discoglossus pictus]
MRPPKHYLWAAEDPLAKTEIPNTSTYLGQGRKWKAAGCRAALQGAEAIKPEATGQAGAVLKIENTRNNYLVGETINLTISYNNAPSAQVSWTKNGTDVASWSTAINATFQGYPWLSLFGNGSLRISNAAVRYSDIYTVTLSILGASKEVTAIQVNIFEPVDNVTVTGSSNNVPEGSPSVNLTCNSTSGEGTVLWTKDGQPLDNYNYTLLDGNHTLQLIRPNRTYNGTYFCKISNPVSSAEGNFTLYVSYSDPVSGSQLSPGAIAGIVIGSVFGALLLIGLIILLIFCLRARKGKNEKDPALNHKDVLRTISGTTLSPDDPAFFTRNNIMYRNSSISMGSYIMTGGENISNGHIYSSSVPSTPPKVKHVTQV